MRSIKKTANLKFEDIVSEELELFRGKKLLVAFSGGKDSLALLDFFYSRKDEYGFRIAACHVNHGLRAEAHIDEDFCRSYCVAHGINFIVKNVSDALHADLSKGIEDAARRERYRALAEALAESGSETILTAHTLSDLVESFFVDLYTGASIFTMGGIGHISGNTVRPMLGVTTGQVEDYLATRALVPVYDVSNGDTAYIRNNVRHNIIPVLDKYGNGFVNTIFRIQDESVKLAAYFAMESQKCIVSDTLESTVIDKNIFLSFPDIMREYTLGKVFSAKFRPTKAHIAEALALTNRDGSRRCDLPDGFMFEISYNSIRLFKNSLVGLFSVEKESGIGNINISGIEIIFSAELLQRTLTVRNRRAGDRFMGRKLKDLFIDKKIGLFERDRAVVIADGREVLWAEYISHSGHLVTIKRRG